MVPVSSFPPARPSTRPGGHFQQDNPLLLLASTGRAPARSGRGAAGVMLWDDGEGELLGRVEVLGGGDLQPHVDDGEGV